MISKKNSLTELKIALAGNPNSGKSTLFNAMTGLNQSVGNYPGITVDKRLGKFKLNDSIGATLIDLPGTYSLYNTSLYETITHQILCNKNNLDYPDVTIVILDACNLRKSLLLLSQLIDLNKKVIVALNMIDLARDMGIVIDINHLEEKLGVSVIPINARKRNGIDDLKEAILCIKSPRKKILDTREVFPEIIDKVNKINLQLLHDTGFPNILEGLD